MLKNVAPIAGVLAVALCGCTQSGSDEMTQAALYFGDIKTIQVSDCNAVLPVQRSIPITDDIADTLMRELLRGVTEEEKAQGLSSSFDDPQNVLGANVGPLSDYYLGVAVREGTAIVDFAEPALRYLNSAACMQSTVKEPITRTLKNLPSVQTVEFSIDGVTFTEWDA